MARPPETAVSNYPLSPVTIKDSQRGGVLFETTVVLSVLIVIAVVILDIRFIFAEQTALKEASRLGARVAAEAPKEGFDESEVQSYARLAVEGSLKAAGVSPDDYAIDIWGITNQFEGSPEHHVQVTVSRKKGGRFYFIPEGMFKSCAGSAYFMESRLPIDGGGGIVKTNPHCNPAEAAK